MKPTEGFSAIAALDLNPIKTKLMHARSGEGWSQEKADAVEFEYRRFLYLMKLFPHERTSPSVDVDTFWHYHILDTIKYAADCDQAFGYFLHHYPYVAMGESDEDADEHLRCGQRMHELYEATFGAPAAGIAAYCGIPAAQAALSGETGEATAYCGMTNGASAYCGATKGVAAYCGATKAEVAYCGATKGATAYCGATKEATAYCGATKGATAYCGATKGAAAYCGATMGATAYCGATKGATAYCGATKGAAAYCGATKGATAYCGATKGATAYCGATVANASC